VIENERYNELGLSRIVLFKSALEHKVVEAIRTTMKV